MSEVIAQYEDGAGAWTVTRAGRALVICTPNGEFIAHTLTRATEFDARLAPEHVLTERYASCDDMGPNGVVWIDGAAYTLEGIAGISAPWKVGDTALYQGMPVTITDDDARTYGGRAYGVKTAAGQWAVTTARHLKPVCCNGAQHSYAGDCIARASSTMWAATTD